MRNVIRLLLRLLASRRRLRRRMHRRITRLRASLAKARVRQECMKVEIDTLWDVVHRNQQRVEKEQELFVPTIRESTTYPDISVGRPRKS